MNNSLISKYIPLNTIVHNLDPRTKIFFVIWYLVDVFIAYNVLEFAILSLILAGIVILSKVSPKFLVSSVKAISILILFTSIIHLVFNKKGEILLEVLGWKIYSGGDNGCLYGYYFAHRDNECCRKESWFSRKDRGANFNFCFGIINFT